MLNLKAKINVDILEIPFEEFGKNVTITLKLPRQR